jgi:hypothetical protein
MHMNPFTNNCCFIHHLSDLMKHFIRIYNKIKSHFVFRCKVRGIVLKSVFFSMDADKPTGIQVFKLNTFNKVYSFLFSPWRWLYLLLLKGQQNENSEPRQEISFVKDRREMPTVPKNGLKVVSLDSDTPRLENPYVKFLR